MSSLSVLGINAHCQKCLLFLFQNNLILRWETGFSLLLTKLIYILILLWDMVILIQFNDSVSSIVHVFFLFIVSWLLNMSWFKEKY